MGSGQDQNSPGQILHPIAIVGILNSKELGRYPSVTPGGCSPQGFSLELALLTSCSFPHMIHVSSISVLCIFGFILTASRIDLSGAHCLAFQVFWIQVEAFWPNNSGILHSLAQHGWCHYLPPTGKVSRIFSLLANGLKCLDWSAPWTKSQRTNSLGWHPSEEILKRKILWQSFKDLV